MRAWAGTWLRTAGVDTLTASRAAVGHAVIRHSGSRPHRVSVGVYDDGPDGGLALRARVPLVVTADASGVALRAAAAGPVPALLLPNDDDVSYCKVRLDPESLIALTSSLGRIADPLSRAVAWNAVRDLVRDTELAPRAYIELAVRHLAAETDTSIAGHVLGYARGTVADRYLRPAWRGAALADISGLCRDLLGRPASADPDGLRLVAGRGLIDSASRPDDIDALRSWLAAGRLPGGPDLDSKLRWQILLRLAVLGALSPAQLEREASGDASAAGRLNAARCRAAVPDEAAKRAAWTAMFDGAAEPGASASGYQLAATAQGFWQADQAELVAGYVPRYFPALADVAVRRGDDVARVLCQHGFPHHAVDVATLRAGQQCLERGDLIGSLRRLMADQLNDLGRAIEVRSGELPTLPVASRLWHGRSHGAATSGPRRRSALDPRARSRGPRQRDGVHALAGPRTRAPLRRLSCALVLVGERP